MKFEKRVASKDDEDILAEVQGLLQKVTDVNTVTKADVLVFKGKVRKAVNDLCQSHNRSVMEADERRRKAEEVEAERQRNTRLTRMPLADVAAMDEGESGPPLVVLSSAPSIKLPTTGAPPKRKRCTITRVRTPPHAQSAARVPTPPPTQSEVEAPLSTGSNRASEHEAPAAAPEAAR